MPIVAVIDLPAPLSPVEQAALPPEPPQVQRPVGPPKSTDDETAWAAYREAVAVYEAARAQALAMGTLRRDAERAMRNAARARGKGDRAAASLTYSVESAVRRLRIFDVRTARQVRSALGDQAAKLGGCSEPACLAPVFAAVEATYVVALSVAPEASNVRVVLYRTGAPTGASTADADADAAGAATASASSVLAEGEVPVGGSARYLIPEAFAPALDYELERIFAGARRAAEGLDWPTALEWLGVSLAIDSNHGESLYLAGYAFFALGDLRSAERRLRAAVTKEARVGEASHYLALIYLRQNRITTAAEHFARALAHGRDSFEARLLLGRAAQLSDPVAATAHLQAAVAMRQRHGESNFLLGMLLLGGEESPAAPAHLEAAVRAGFRPGDAHYELGMFAAGKKQWPKAQRHLEAARKLGRANGEALYILGRLYVDPDPVAAVAALTEARRKGATATDLDFLLGKAAVAAKDHVTAVAALGRAVTAGSHVAAAHLLLAGSYLAQDNTPMAASHFAPAIELGRDSFVARLCIADAARLRRDAAAALPSYQAALVHQPGDGAASFGAALALIDLDRVADAVPHFERAVTAGYEVARAQGHLGRAALAAGDAVAGRKHFEAAAVAGSVESAVHRALARARGRDRSIDAAAASWSRTLELVPGDAEASFELGLLRINQGRAVEAAPLLEHATGSLDYRGRAHRLLGELAIANDDPQRALGHFQEAMKVADGSNSADFDLLVGAGQAALAATRDDLAKQYLARALAYRPGDGRLAYLLGELQIRARRYAEARAFLRIALATGHRVGYTQALLGQASDRLGDQDAAHKHYSAALRAGIDSAAGRLVLGAAASARGEKKVAVGHFAAAGRAALRERQPELVAEALSAGRAIDPNAAPLVAIAAELEKLVGP